MAARLSEETLVAQNPLIIRLHRIMEAFAKSNDERDFFLDRLEGFLVYVDLDKTEEDLYELSAELQKNKNRYVAIPKLTFYEIKKVMEGFVNEKVYDIDTKEKLLDIIQSKEARENFLEFIYDHHNEMEKWQQFYQERFRIRIIEWLRQYNFDFVFEEDLDLTKSIVEKVRISMFDPKANKEVVQARKLMVAKAKTYYSNEALNPRPKRGRPPKQVVKVETEPQFATDIFLSVPKPIKQFLFTPDYRSSAAVYVFSGKFTSEAELLAYRRQQVQSASNFEAQSLSQKLSALRSMVSPFQTDENDSLGIEGYRGVVQQVEAGRQAAKKSLEMNKKDLSKNRPVKETLVKKKPTVAAKPVAKVEPKKTPQKFPFKKAPMAKTPIKPVAKFVAKPAVKSPIKSTTKFVAKPVAKPVVKSTTRFVTKTPTKVPFKSSSKQVATKKPIAKKPVAVKPPIKKPLFGKKAPIKAPVKKAPVKAMPVVKKNTSQPKARLRPLPPKKVKRK